MHRYPGIGSDSDLHTFGHRFKPWVGKPLDFGETVTYRGLMFTGVRSDWSRCPFETARAPLPLVMFRLSCPDLIRASIMSRKRRLDCRVKPGNDGAFDAGPLPREGRLSLRHEQVAVAVARHGAGAPQPFLVLQVGKGGRIVRHVGQ